MLIFLLLLLFLLLFLFLFLLLFLLLLFTPLRSLNCRSKHDIIIKNKSSDIGIIYASHMSASLLPKAWPTSEVTP